MKPTVETVKLTVVRGRIGSMSNRKSEYASLIDHFNRKFEAEATRRDRYEGLEWIDHERRAMTLHVLDEFRYRGLNPAGVREAVERAEQSACGHSDYGKKLAIGCADIVVTAAKATQ